jgi:hypothetical protein
MPVDRRKSYIDVMERVLGASQIPESASPSLRETYLKAMALLGSATPKKRRVRNS